MNSQKIIFTTVIVSIVSSFNASLSLAKPSLTSSPKCNAAIANVQSKFSIKQTSTTTLANQPGKPTRKTTIDMIVNGGRRGSIFMDNTSLQLAMSRKIINSCGDVGRISYQLFQSDYIRVYGLINGKVREFSCKEIYGKNNWGDMCS
jgi:hypothetical protein